MLNLLIYSIKNLRGFKKKTAWTFEIPRRFNFLNRKIKRLSFSLSFLPTACIERSVKRIEVLAVKIICGYTQALAETNKLKQLRHAKLFLLFRDKREFFQSVIL